MRSSQAVVSGPLLLPSREPDPRVQNPRGAAELRLGEPESAEGEGSHLSLAFLSERETRHLLAGGRGVLCGHAPGHCSSVTGDI